MKLEELFENIALGTRFAPEELEIIYSSLVEHRDELDIGEIKKMAQIVSEREDWKRNVGSAVLALARMHVLVHGVAPHGVTERTAETWMVPSGPMDKFAESKGINVTKNVNRAWRELKSRRIKPKKTYDEAKKEVVDHWMSIRHEHSREHFDREKLIADVMAGLTAEEAFNRQKDYEAAA